MVNIFGNTLGDAICYPVTDYLGSIIALYAEDGTLIEKRSYDAWGRPRNPADWEDHENITFNVTNRGYTMHEHMLNAGLINMNGRVYDPVIGRMLSPDNYVQDMSNPQNYNRYTYVLNNPLKYVDPTGEFTEPWEDTYELDENGNTTWLDDTKYYQEEDGSVTTVANGESYDGTGTEVDKLQQQGNPKNSIYIGKSVMEGKTSYSQRVSYESQTSFKKQSKTVQVDQYRFQNQNAAREFFEFAASASKVEFSNVGLVHDATGTKFNSVSTAHEHGFSLGVSKWNNKSAYTILKADHSHPDNSSAHDQDREGILQLNKKNRNAIFRVYQPKAVGKKYKEYDVYR